MTSCDTSMTRHMQWMNIATMPNVQTLAFLASCLELFFSSKIIFHILFIVITGFHSQRSWTYRRYSSWKIGTEWPSIADWSRQKIEVSHWSRLQHIENGSRAITSIVCDTMQARKHKSTRAQVATSASQSSSTSLSRWQRSRWWQSPPSCVTRCRRGSTRAQVVQWQHRRHYHQDNRP